MATAKLDTSFNIELDFTIAPFPRRLLAWLLDLMVCWLYVKVMASLFGIASYFIFTSQYDLKGILISLPVLGYHLIWETLMNGMSPGKMAVQLQVITATGGQPSLSQYLLRWMFRILDFPLLIAGLIGAGELPWWLFPLSFSGLACVILTPRSQRLGDLVAGTILIDRRKRVSWEDTVFTELDAAHQPAYPQVMQLSDRDVNTLKSIIDNVRKKKDDALARRIAERIKAKLLIETRQTDIEFLETLLKDYNYYTSG